MNKKGLTLVETLVASAIITTLMLGAIPPTVKMLQQRVAQKTAKEIIAIQEAEKNYWIDKLNSNGTGEWAPDITTLKNEGYLPSSWSATNLFGYSYTISTSSGLCSVSTRVPKGVEGVLQTLCPNVNVNYSGNYAIVSSSIPVPGQEPTMQNVLHRSGSEELRIAEENIGTKKGLIVGDAQMMSATKEGDIYVKALKEKGISKDGWLSEAKFPTDIKGFLIDGMRIMNLKWNPSSSSCEFVWYFYVLAPGGSASGSVRLGDIEIESVDGDTDLFSYGVSKYQNHFKVIISAKDIPILGTDDVFYLSLVLSPYIIVEGSQKPSIPVRLAVTGSFAQKGGTSIIKKAEQSVALTFPRTNDYTFISSFSGKEYTGEVKHKHKCIEGYSIWRESYYIETNFHLPEFLTEVWLIETTISDYKHGFDQFSGGNRWVCIVK